MKYFVKHSFLRPDARYAYFRQLLLLERLNLITDNYYSHDDYEIEDDIIDNKITHCAEIQFLNIFFNNRPKLDPELYSNIIKSMNNTENPEVILFYMICLLQYDFHNISNQDIGKILCRIEDFDTFTKLGYLYNLLCIHQNVLKPI